MESRRVFMMGNDRISHIPQIGAFFYPHKKIKPMYFSDVRCFKDMTDEALASLLFVGHADVTSYGECSEKEFVTAFVNQFPADKKLALKDLYLIGCEVGLIHKGTSMAQKITDDLYDAGFENIQVHAIAKPEEAAGDCMYVEEENFGYLNAYVVNKEDSDRLEVLFENKSLHAEEIRKIKEERAFTFIQSANPYQELNKAQHTFIPKENILERKKRLDGISEQSLCKEQARALALLKIRRDYEQAKENTHTVQKLNFIINQIKHVPSHAWLRTMHDFVRYFKVKLFGVTFNNRSNTLKMLEYLSEGDFASAESIVSAQGHTTKIAFHLEARVEKSGGKTPAEKDSLHEMLQLLKAKEKINALVAILENEIQALRESCFSFFHRFEINTKVQKKNALSELVNAVTYTELKMRAAHYMLDNPRVMRSYKTTRTRDLLDQIVRSPKDFWPEDLTFKAAR